jgi:hypothetical protein
MINICPRPLLVAASVVALTSGLFAGSGVEAEVVVRGVEGRTSRRSASGSDIL